MRGNGFSVWVRVVAAAVLVQSVSGGLCAAPASEGKAPPKTPRVLTVKAGEVRGRLLDPTGKPVAETTVKVLDAEGKVVATAKTAKDGTFTIKHLPAGEYTVAVRRHRPLKLKVVTKGASSAMTLVVPAASGSLRRTLVIVGWVVVGGTAVATGISVPLATSDGGDGHRSSTAASSGTRRTTRRRRVSP